MLNGQERAPEPDLTVVCLQPCFGPAIQCRMSTQIRVGDILELDPDAPGSSGRSAAFHLGTRKLRPETTLAQSERARRTDRILFFFQHFYGLAIQCHLVSLNKLGDTLELELAAFGSDGRRATLYFGTMWLCPKMILAQL